MIFVTVGTHEQPFNRLLKEVDRLKEQSIIKEDVFIQKGYSNYEPKHCKYQNFISNDEMNEKIQKARVVITHGGPASFMNVLKDGKIPIVVPRQEKFDEHINNHQLEFAVNVKEKGYKIIIVENIDELKDWLFEDFLIKDNEGKTEQFVTKFKRIIDEMMR